LGFERWAGVRGGGLTGGRWENGEGLRGVVFLAQARERFHTLPMQGGGPNLVAEIGKHLKGDRV